MEKIMLEIQKLGFSQYESKAYVSLLQQAPVTGYELSKRCGVPRSMIYEVLNKLSERGAIYTLPSEPVKYSPVPAKELLKRLRRDVDATFAFLDQSLAALGSNNELAVIARIHGREPVFNELHSLVESSKSELWLSVWEPQATLLSQSVACAEERGVNVCSIVFGNAACRLGTTFHHDYMPADVVKARIGGQLTLAVKDRQEVIIANFLDHGASWAVKTQDPALVLVATEYVRHDIMIEAVMRHFGADKLDELLRKQPELHAVVTGKFKDRAKKQ
ncbi:TrmB family transcriptional regulator [Azotosporobacter soli]|uniref:TrmB family transcriptional regulator n=1 Tax=Azotosporobacter soli TaxID=3055040 RepID=UPI0031FEEA9D